MERVEVTRPIMPPEQYGIYALVFMQVCAVPDATDEEVLEVCNRNNPSGTSNGWATVHRKDTEKVKGAVPCNEHPDRIHLLVSC